MFKNLKRAFGFAGDDEYDDVIHDDCEREAPSLPSSPMSNNDTDQPSSIDIDVDTIFTHVVEIFNKTIPDFFKQSVNPEAQRRYIYDTLDKDVKDYLDKIGQRAQAMCESRWSSDKSNLNAQVKQLEARAKEIEEKRLELSQKQLSADRQKRALSERVHDLEKQVSKLDADREQLDLENKSLLNKLKVATVFEKENDELRTELNRLQAENLHMRNSSSESSSGLKVDDAMAKELETTKESLADASAKLEQLLDSNTTLKRDNASLSASKDKLAADNQQLQTSITELNKQLEQTKQLAERLQLKNNEEALAANETCIKEQTRTIQEQSEKLQAQTMKIQKQAEKIAAQEATIRQLNDDCHEAQEVAAQLGAIEKQLAQFRQIKEQKDATIARLKNELKLAKDQLTQTNSARSTTEEIKPSGNRKTTRGNDGNHYNRSSYGGNKTQERRSRPETPIEDILTDTDWLVKPSSNNKDIDRRGDHKPKPDNDSQLSLF
ncbi:MAG: hypothetical protein J6C44_02220 [Muribaculaceae bacterium]|nr:hypothetical protein [Muribaculaceae bacterium]